MNISFDAYLSKKEREVIILSMKIIGNKLPFLMQISKDERKKIANIGVAREPFVRNVIKLANQRDEFLPKYTSLKKFNEAMEMFDFFIEYMKLARSLNEGIEDTSMILGAGLYKTSNSYLKITRMAVDDGIAGTDSLVEDMERFLDKLGGPRNPDSPSEDDDPTPNDW